MAGTTERLFGKSIKRREDPRFITGRGQYVDDLRLPGLTYAAFVRSPHAHARIRSIDVSQARTHPGVVAIFTGKDMTGVNSLPCGWDLRKAKNIPGVVQDLVMPPHMPLTSDVARHVGDPVAVVIADTQAAATDAAEKVVVAWEPLPAVTATDKAAASGTPVIHADAPGNVAFKWALGDGAATDAAFKSADVTVKKRIVNQRLVANAMEPRACVARFDEATGELTLWVTSQNPHVHRLLMCAFVLGIPEHKVRVIAPDVGGGFGSKIFLYNGRSSAPGRRGRSSGRSAGPPRVARRTSPTRTAATTSPTPSWRCRATARSSACGSRRRRTSAPISRPSRPRCRPSSTGRS
jgi:carbon-monoxide dehydrogenase large subunit